MLPNEYCTETIEEYYIRDVSPIKRDDILTRIFIDKETGLQLSRDCLSGRDYDEVMVENWPPRLAGWLSGHGVLTNIPPLDPACRGGVIDDAPVITSPESGTKFMLVDYLPVDYQKILLSGSTSSGRGVLHWFIDNSFYATADEKEKLFYVPERGVHEVMCVDEQGRSQALTFEVN
jgi:penicillin-binding protein 1C